MRRAKSKSRSSAAPRALAPCGLWAASINVVGEVRTRSRRPGEIACAKPLRTVATSSGWPAETPKKASTAARATAEFLAWCSPCRGRKISSYRPPRPWILTCWPPTAMRDSRAANSEPERATPASTSTACCRMTRIASGSCSATTTMFSLGVSGSSASSRDLIMPAFSPAISARVSPR